MRFHFGQISFRSFPGFGFKYARAQLSIFLKMAPQHGLQSKYVFQFISSIAAFLVSSCASLVNIQSSLLPHLLRKLQEQHRELQNTCLDYKAAKRRHQKSVKS